MAGLINPRDLDRRITFQARAARANPPDTMDAGKPRWEEFATVWAQVQEMLPSRGEKLAEGLVIAARPARIRIRWRPDITADMQILYAGRTLKIMGPPVELGRREGLEMMAQDYSTAGNPS